MTKPNGRTGEVSERKWTKGPWEVTYDKNGTVRIGPSHNCTVAVVWFAPSGDSDANARLIAAAPSLYESLKSATAYMEALESFTGYNLEVLNWHKNGDTAPFDGFFDENRGDFDLAKARAALSAAKGERDGCE